MLPDSSNPLFAELVQAVEQVAAQRGYALVMATSNFEGSVERQNVERLASRQVRGLVASALNAGTWTSGTGAEFQPPCSTQTGRCPGSTQSGRDFHDGTRSVVEHLITIHEARTVALVTGYLDFVEVNSRERGWQEALARHGLPEGPILEGPFTRDGDCSPCSAGCRGRWSGTGRPWSVGDGPGSRCSPRPATGSGGVLVSRVIIDADRRARHALRAVWGEYAEPGPVLGQGRAESAGGRAADSGPGTGRRQRGNATSASNQVRWSGRLGASRIVSARSASAGSARTGSGAGSGQSPRGQ